MALLRKLLYPPTSQAGIAVKTKSKTMKYRLNCTRLMIMATVGMLSVSAFSAEAGAFRKSSRPTLTGQYIVILKGQEVTADVDEKINRMAARWNARVGERWNRAVHGFVAQMSEADAVALAQDPAVALVEEDGIVTINTTQSNPTWGLDRIDQTSLPLSASYTYDTTGQGVTAYIIDTGILASHTDFGGRVSGGYTAISDVSGTTDCHGHGTHVAGTVGGSLYGVAKGVSLVPVRVLDCQGSGASSGVIAGLNWIIANKKLPAVANMSLGGGASSALDTAVQNAIAAGVTVVVAAGNSNTDACNGSPARAPAALTVGATTNTDARASYSNYGTCLDLFAPGSNILSAYYSSNTATANFSGTSMASPHVAGVAALYLAANPGAAPSAVATAIVQNATPDKVTSAGAGSLNRLLYSGFIKAGPTDTTPPAVNLTAPTAATTLTGTVILAASASDPGGSGVAKVEFFVDNASVGMDTSSPYALSWNSASVTNGSHIFFASATDVAGNPGNSSVVNATTANNTTPPTCATASQLLANQGFESGPTVAWTASAGVIDNSTSTPARSGRWKAWMNGYGRSYTETLYQRVTIPADACSASVKFWLRIATNEPASAAAVDTLTLTVRSTTGTILRTLATYSNKDKSSGYVQKNFNLAPFKGQTVSIQFTGVENSSRATSFLIDDTDLAIVR
jgi:subtilisin family serine protease